MLRPFQEGKHSPPAPRPAVWECLIGDRAVPDAMRGPTPDAPKQSWGVTGLRALLLCAAMPVPARLRLVSILALFSAAALLVACSSGGGPATCDLTPTPGSGGCPGGPTATGEAPAELLLDSGVTVEANLTFQADAGIALQGDLYVPPGAAGSDAGIVVLVHGGTWNSCELRRASTAAFAEATAQDVGAGVFNIEYRLTQEGGGYPNDLRDVYCAIQWISAHAADYQLNGQRVALVGASAGGQLALNAALELHRTDLDPHCGPLPPLSMVVAYSAPTDLPTLAASTSPIANAVLDHVGTCDNPVPQCDVGKACDRCVDASPVAHACVSGDTTAFLLVQAPDPFDPIVPYSQVDELAQAFSLIGATGQLIIPAAQQLTDQGCAANDAQNPAHGFLTPCLANATHDAVIPLLKAAVGH